MKAQTGSTSGPAFGTSRRNALKMVAVASATAGLSQFAPPAIIKARGAEPVKIGVDNPLSGVYADEGRNQLHGMQIAAGEVNAKGGILGRPIELIVQDSTSNNTGTAIQVAQSFIELDKIKFLLGNINSGSALALSALTHKKDILMIGPSGHADALSGKDCHWNYFQLSPTTSVDVDAIAPSLIRRYGKKFYFLVPDYAFGQSLLRAYMKNLKKYGATSLGEELIPLGTADYSSYLIGAEAAKPNVLIVLQAGADQTNALKQIVQFGLNKRFHIAGAGIELETLESLPPSSRIGDYVMEWYWDQPDVPHVSHFVEVVRKKTGSVPTEGTFFGYVAVWTCALAANNAKSLDALRMARALDGYTLPPEIALQTYPATYRANQHNLIGTLWVGHAQAAGRVAGDLFKVTDIVDSKTIAPTIAEAGCHMTWPS